MYFNNIHLRGKKMRKIKILTIAPYKGLKELIMEEAKKRKNWEIEAYIADMMEGRDLVKSLDSSKFDFIISRAGTAELIREVTNIPVIDIKISILDMISAINLATNYSGTFAVVGYRSITEKADIAKELNQGSYEVKTISSYTEIERFLLELKNKGVDLIIGDVITVTKAKNLGLNTILVTSGKESVLNCFDEITNLTRVLTHEKKKTDLINKIINGIETSIFAFDGEKRLIFSNKQDDQYITEQLNKLISQVQEKRHCKIIKQLDNHTFEIIKKVFLVQDEKFIVFYVKELKTVYNSTDPAITIYNQSDDYSENPEIITTKNNRLKKILDNLETYASIPNPVIITGEQGTGKDTIANMIYMNGPNAENPFVIIDAAYMNKVKWNKILEDDDSFFTMDNITIYIKNLHTINLECQMLLENYFENTYVYKRNKFIFSYLLDYADFLEDSTILPFLQNKLLSFHLVLPNLSERSEDISSLSSLFIGESITKHGKQIHGLSPKALQMLEEFNWTYNIDQLKRVIEECIILTDNYYISDETVKTVLENEKTKSNQQFGTLDLDKPLNEITKDIITFILSQENFNQTKAAERLGISRSTLWRKLKE